MFKKQDYFNYLSFMLNTCLKLINLLQIENFEKLKATAKNLIIFENELKMSNHLKELKILILGKSFWAKLALSMLCDKL